MKDLTDYFAGLTKKADVKNSDNVRDTPLEIAETRIDSSLIENTTDELKVLSNMQNSAEDKTKDVKVKKRKRKKRKPSDPVVKNITELFSNSLSIISPNASLVIEPIKDTNDASKKKSKDKILKQMNKQSNDIQVSLIIENKVAEKDNKLSGLNHKKEETTDNQSSKTSLFIEVEVSQNDCCGYKDEKDENSLDNTKSKLNAFQLMMESRNRSIGQNSPGKDLAENDIIEITEENKEKLSARKKLLQNWAEKKGASKRKRKEEDRDEIINHKLNKRARRLKKLLQFDTDKNIDDDFADRVVNKKKRLVKRIISSSESSEGSAENTNSTEILKSPVLEIIEENAQDQVLNSSVSKGTKQSLLTFFGVLNKSRETDKGNNKTENDKEIQAASKKRMRKSKLSWRKTKTENSVEESTTEQLVEEEKSKTSVRKKKLDESSYKSREKLKSHEKLPQANESLDECNDSFTLRSLRSWKMKIKMNTEDVEKDMGDFQAEEKRILRTKRKTSLTSVNHISDESSTEGKVRTSRMRKQKRIMLSDSENNSVELTRSKNHISNKPDKTVDIILSDSDNDSDKLETKEIRSKPLKVAPVFIKATPKPKLAPEVIEARKQFLMSGIPSSLKKAIEKQQSMGDREYDIFPSVSHVQQRCENYFWNLARPQLDLIPYSPLKMNTPKPCSSLTNSHMDTKLNIKTDIKKVDQLKTLLNEIKANNPNYPVYKSFRLIYEKSGNMTEQAREREILPRHKRKRKHDKNFNKSVDTVEPDIQAADLIKHAMWTEKYKPTCADDIIGNSEGVKNLKKWLETWLKFSQEIKTKKKLPREDSTSESEFDITDCDSRDSTRLPGNTVIIGGPCGSGKSTAIYAICRELGFNVIEINASSKRTGKRLLQELQEATQSHQLLKSEQNMQNFLQTNTPSKEKMDKEQQAEKKVCVLLIEDLDIVFEQDDGFISALTQIVATSKRPIVMTTTDSSSIYVQKFITQYDYISFLPLSSQTLATWLQILCLVEGLFVKQGDVGSLLEFNRGDVRKTLLQLQFWVQSGGQIVRDEIPIKIESKRSSTEEKMTDDEQPPPIKDKSSKKSSNTLVHSNCINSFVVFKDHEPFNIPYYLNLGMLWWNISSVLNTPNFSHYRLNRFTEKKHSINVKDNSKKPMTSLTEKIKLRSMQKLYDAFTFTDVMFRKIEYLDGTEPNVKNYSSDIKDSSELSENMDSYDGYVDFVHEVTHNLVNGHIKEYNESEIKDSTLDMSVPSRVERRWRAKQHVCEDVFHEAMPFSSYVERKSVALDYLPYLRNISRSECHRAANNTKRGNRFRNYLRDLNINYNDSTLKLACNILTMNDEF